MSERAPETSVRSEPRSHFSQIAKCASWGLLVWTIYVVLGVLVGWVCFWFAAADVWHGGMGPLGAHAGGYGAVLILLVLLFMPPFWVSLAYAVGVPLAFAWVGQTMGIKAALQRATRERSDLIAASVCNLAHPVARRLVSTPGARTVKEVTGALMNQVKTMEGATPLGRWLLGKVIRSLKISEIFATADIISGIDTKPEATLEKLRSAVDARIQQTAQGALFNRAWMLAGPVVVITLSRRFWIYW